MPGFSKASKSRLATCHPDLQKVMREAIKEVDFSVISGRRLPEKQFSLYQKGRKYIDGKWVIVDKGSVVTYKDGYTKLSRHNTKPSEAVDIVPFPIDWKNIQRFKDLSVVIKRIAKELGVELQYGGDWRWKDYPHYQIKK